MTTNNLTTRCIFMIVKTDFDRYTLLDLSRFLNHVCGSLKLNCGCKHKENDPTPVHPSKNTANGSMLHGIKIIFIIVIRGILSLST